ncbi:transposase [Metabacillus halosaccharovorans]|uniref:transposase n=1 Tax=Metabacillus halosaccharovorans TaxID=930124 RepID=UPI00203E3CDE|nr:transposase [Metabacillus halosaccharovorans]MCM3443116.1 transposase [Metabacillus halosaccharovorans]
MPYKKRIYIPERFYHIISRGNRRDPLFRNTSDFQAFLHILQQLYDKYPFELASYCLMNNHYHLQLRSKKAPISKMMALINKRYANYYNTKYRLTGHVYEKRFFDKIIDDKEGMLAVSRYIHLNPVEAKMVKLPEHYPWSSFVYYKNDNVVVPCFLNRSCLLDYYKGTLQQQKERYCNTVKIEPQERTR